MKINGIKETTQIILLRLIFLQKITYKERLGNYLIK